MGEAAPAVLADAIKATKDPRLVGFGLALTMQAMGRALESEEADSVRRTFRAAQPILAAADAFKTKVAAVAVEGLRDDGRDRGPRRTPRRSAQVARRGGDARKVGRGAHVARAARLARRKIGAEGALDRASKRRSRLETIAKDPASRAEILLLESDIQREGGDASGARKPLGDALRDLSKARGASEGDGRARVERLIARTLDRFGAGPFERDEGARACARGVVARQASGRGDDRSNRRAAFVKGDLAGARDGLARAQSAELGREDIVYYALWVRILERQQKASPKAQTGDGSAEKLLARTSLRRPALDRQGRGLRIGKAQSRGARRCRTDADAANRGTLSTRRWRSESRATRKPRTTR